MKHSNRFVSLDFLRGLAILIMLVLHVVKTILDINGLQDLAFSIPLINIMAVLTLPFLGGLAGFFLMVSAIGNTVSMTKQLRNGRKALDVAKRQIVGGLLLLVFGFLAEGLIGFNGTIAEIFKNFGRPEEIEWDRWLWRWSHMATIQAIAWSQILNGLVHGLLARNGRWKDYQKMKKSYFIAAAVVLIFTPILWNFAKYLYPGFPYTVDPDTGKWVMYIFIGETSWKDALILFILNPLAAHSEPIFPYLAASFLGTIVGMYIMQEEPKPTLAEMKNLFKVGAVMMIIGGLGTLVNMGYKMADDFMEGIDLYIQFWDHTALTTEQGVPFAGWLFQFLILNGFALNMILIVFLLVEFRGYSNKFATRTRLYRRFGLVAFSVYCLQWIYNVVHYFLTINDTPYHRMGWGGTFIGIIITVVFFHFFLMLWEKVGFFGSIESVLSILSAFLVPGKRKQRNKHAKWYSPGIMNLQQTLYLDEWIDLSDKKEDPVRDSKLSNYLSIAGYFFFPLHFITISMLISLKKRQYWDNLAKNALVKTIIGLSLTLIVLIICCIFSIEQFGIEI